MTKISIIGAGMTGATAAHWLAERELADLVLVDIVEGMPQGKALDLLEAMPIINKDSQIVGSNDYAATEGSDLVVITAGIPRKPGMSREDLVNTNTDIVRKATEATLKYSPNAIYIILTNPLDSMCYVAMMAGGLPRQRVIGQAGILDSARMRAFVALELGVSVENVACYVLGGHGDSMVPLVRYSTLAGIPLPDLVRLGWTTQERLDAIVQRTREGGAEIVKLLKTGSAYYAPASAAIQMAESYLKDKKRVLPCAAHLKGEYGVEGLFIGVPAVIGERGVERVLEISLNPAEREMFDKSVEAVRGLVEATQKLV